MKTGMETYKNIPNAINGTIRNEVALARATGECEAPTRELASENAKNQSVFSQTTDGRLKFTDHATSQRQCDILADKYGYMDPQVDSNGACTVKEPSLTDKAINFVSGLFN